MAVDATLSGISVEPEWMLFSEGTSRLVNMRCRSFQVAEPVTSFFLRIVVKCAVLFIPVTQPL